MAAAMPRNKTTLNELGTICSHGGKFRAHIQFRDDDGKHKDIHGPNRSNEEESQKKIESNCFSSIDRKRKRWKTLPSKLLSAPE